MRLFTFYFLLTIGKCCPSLFNKINLCFGSNDKLTRKVVRKTKNCTKRKREKITKTSWEKPDYTFQAKHRTADWNSDLLKATTLGILVLSFFSACGSKYRSGDRSAAYSCKCTIVTQRWSQSEFVYWCKNQTYWLCLLLLSNINNRE